jgi:hypothetical protein
MSQFRDFAEEVSQINTPCEALNVVQSEIASPDRQFTRRARNPRPATVEQAVIATWPLAEAVEDAKLAVRADNADPARIADEFIRHAAKVATAKYDAGCKTKLGPLMGRDRRNEARTEHFTAMVRNMMETPAWRALSPCAQALYPWLRLEWHGAKANNNGRIVLSVRQAAERMRVGINTAARAFHDLQAKGFLVVKKPAHLGMKGQATSPEFELTEIALPGKDERNGPIVTACPAAV